MLHFIQGTLYVGWVTDCPKMACTGHGSLAFDCTVRSPYHILSNSPALPDITGPHHIVSLLWLESCAMWIPRYLHKHFCFVMQKLQITLIGHHLLMCTHVFFYVCYFHLTCISAIISTPPWGSLNDYLIFPFKSQPLSYNFPHLGPDMLFPPECPHNRVISRYYEAGRADDSPPGALSSCWYVNHFSKRRWLPAPGAFHLKRTPDKTWKVALICRVSTSCHFFLWSTWERFTPGPTFIQQWIGRIPPYRLFHD